MHSRSLVVFVRVLWHSTLPFGVFVPKIASIMRLSYLYIENSSPSLHTLCVVGNYLFKSVSLVAHLFPDRTF